MEAAVRRKEDSAVHPGPEQQGCEGSSVLSGFEGIRDREA